MRALRRTAAILLACVASIWLGAPAAAQSDAETLAELRECAAIEVDRARWNCFDGVFASEAAVATAAQAAAAQPLQESRTVGRAPASAPAPVAAAQPGARASRRPAAAPEPEPESEWIVTVVEMYPRVRGNLRFVTTDGEIYTQPYGEPKGRYPDLPFEALVEAGALGGFFIKPLEGGPRTRVSLED
jgi:hypothetical protein